VITITQFSLFGIEFRVLFVLNLFHFHGCRPRLRAITLDCPPWQRRFYFWKSNLFQMATRNWVKQLNLRKPTRLTLTLNQRKHYLTDLRTPKLSILIVRKQLFFLYLNKLKNTSRILFIRFIWFRWFRLSSNLFNRILPIEEFRKPFDIITHRSQIVAFSRHLMASLFGFIRDCFRNVIRSNKSFIIKQRCYFEIMVMKINLKNDF